MINNNNLEYIIPPYLFQEPEPQGKKEKKFSLLLALPQDLIYRLSGWLKLPDVTALCIVLKDSPNQLWREARALLTKNEISRMREPSLLEGRIECLRYLAGIGNVKKIKSALLKIDGYLFPDLSNPPQEGTYKHPGYQAFLAMGEMACLENKPNVVKAILENPSFQGLCQKPEEPRNLRRGGRFTHLPSHIRKKIDRYHYLYSLSTSCKNMPVVLAKICCTLNRVKCLKALYEKNFQKVASGWDELITVSQNHKAQECLDLVLYNIDTSEPLHW